MRLWTDCQEFVQILYSGVVIRIGELARRAGVSAEVARAWERRYRLVKPKRTDGGFRLYDEDDVARIRHMRELIAGGMSAAEAARVARGAETPPASATQAVPARLAQELRDALTSLDDERAHRAIDDLLAAVTVETFLSDAVLPVLRDVGEAWQRKALSIGHEHFATTLLRGRLLGIARGWDRGLGRRVALACLPGELHDVGLIAFGIALWRRGWRILYFGQDTPLDSLRDDAAAGGAATVVIASVDPALFERHARELRALSRSLQVAIGGAGATEKIASTARARLLPADPVAAAAQLTDGA
jgi:DNA-binding transcriptional MerR regulator